MAERWGRSTENLGTDVDIAVAIEGETLGHAMASLVLTISPERIILGGGVMKLPGLIEATRRRMLESLGGYVTAPALENGAEHFLVAPELGDRSGVAGGFVLAECAAMGLNR